MKGITSARSSSASSSRKARGVGEVIFEMEA